MLQRPKSRRIFIYSACHKNQPISRSQAWRIVRQAAEETGLDGNVSCHSLRKTFGYHAWKQGVPPAMLMMIYNHSSYQITKRYLGIIQEEKDDVFTTCNYKTSKHIQKEKNPRQLKV